MTKPDESDREAAALVTTRRTETGAVRIRFGFAQPPLLIGERADADDAEETAALWRTQLAAALRRARRCERELLTGPMSDPAELVTVVDVDGDGTVALCLQNGAQGEAICGLDPAAAQDQAESVRRCVAHAAAAARATALAEAAAALDEIGDRREMWAFHEAADRIREIAEGLG